MPRTISTQRQIVRDFGTCLDFRGQIAGGDRDVVTHNANLSVTNYTFAAWINPRGNGSFGFGRIVHKTSAYQFYINNANQLAVENGASSKTSNTGILTYNAWQHVAVTYNGANVTFYVNGVAQGSPAQTTNPTVNTNNFVVGNTVAADGTFNGLIDDVRVYSEALTATQILNLYYGIEPPTTNLELWHKFDEGSGTSAIDSSGNSNTGTISGATYSTDVFIKSRTIAGQRIPVLRFTNSLAFNNTSTSVDINTTGLDVSVFTYCAWIKLTGSGNRTIIANNANGGPHFRVDIANTLTLNKENVTGIGTSTGTIGSAWTHVAVTYNNVSGALVFYINGVVSGTATNAQTFTFTQFWIGRQLVNEWFSGLMNDVRIYNTVLTKDQITSVMIGQEYTTGLLRQYLLTEGSGTNADDSSSSNSDGLIANGAWSTDTSSVARTPVT